MKSLCYLSRPWYWLPTLSSSFAGFYYNLDSPAHPLLLCSILLTSGVGLSAYAEAINDICDFQYDSLGSRKYFLKIPLSGGSGVLTDGRATIRKAQTATIVFAFIGSIFSLGLSKKVFAFYFAGIALATIYSVKPFRFKSRGIFALLAHIIGYGPIAFFIGYFSSHNNFIWDALFRSIIIGTWVGIVGLTADLLDFDDDVKNKIDTLPIILGRNTTSSLVVVSSSIVYLVVTFIFGLKTSAKTTLFLIIATLLVLYNTSLWRYRYTTLPANVHGIAVLLEVLFPIYLFI